MCVPVAAAVALGSFALDAGGKLMAAHAQNTAAATNTMSANSDQTQGFNSLALRGTQENDAAIGADQSVDKRLQLDAGINNNAAANNGVNGNSITALSNELKFQQGTYHDSVAENLSNQINQLGQEKLGIEARTQSHINSVQPANPWATAIGIAGAALRTGTQMASQRSGGDTGTP